MARFGTLVGALVLVIVGCRRGEVPRSGAPVVDAAIAGGPTLVEIRGSAQALAGLHAVKGILTSEHGSQQLADGTWAVTTYVSSPQVIDAIRARGLAVKVVATPEQIRREGEQIARELQAAERRDARD
jgi:hypothetical protein